MEWWTHITDYPWQDAGKWVGVEFIDGIAWGMGIGIGWTIGEWAILKCLPFLKSKSG